MIDYIAPSEQDVNAFYNESAQITPMISRAFLGQTTAFPVVEGVTFVPVRSIRMSHGLLPFELSVDSEDYSGCSKFIAHKGPDDRILRISPSLDGSEPLCASKTDRQILGGKTRLLRQANRIIDLSFRKPV